MLYLEIHNQWLPIRVSGSIIKPVCCNSFTLKLQKTWGERAMFKSYQVTLEHKLMGTTLLSPLGVLKNAIITAWH